MNKEQIRKYADLIVNKSIEITAYESGNNIEFRYKFNSTIATVINRNRYRFLHEYDDFTILRDEAFATYYESILRLIEKEGYTEDDMELIANDINEGKHDKTLFFIAMLKGYMNNNLSMHLIDPTRRDQSGGQSKYITTTTIYDSDVYKYMKDDAQEDQEDKDELYKPLYDLLTESQQEFIHGDRVYDKKRTENEKIYKTKKRVKAKMKDNDIMKEVSTTREDTINKILDTEDPNEFVMLVKKWQNKGWFTDIIAEYVPANHRIDFNTNKITDKTIMAYRGALHKAIRNHAY